jgi:uncharacterized protein YcaQ
LASAYTFSKDQARTMLLAAQGFAESPQPIGHDEVEQAIRRMGVLQIDTISVVARSPYFVLWSRLGQYDPKLLEDLLESARLFEYWSHEACFIPIDDFAYYRRLMIEAKQHPKRFDWLANNSEAAAAMLEHVRKKGPTRSSDFERTDGEKGSWWNWKDEKIALDFLHTAGELMILKRDKFQRIYELRERVLPHWQDLMAPSYEEVLRYLLEKTVRCLGVACTSWCGDYFRLPKKDFRAQLEWLATEGRLLPATIEGVAEPAFLCADQTELADRVLAGLDMPYANLLSPFDPIVWDRKRAFELFDFDYGIECYVPEPKRKFGYFVLPILVGNIIVGRLDAKAHRKDKIFEVKELFLEPGVQVDESLLFQIGGAIRRCAVWHKTPTVVVTKARTAKLAKQIQSAAKVRRSGPKTTDGETTR